MNRTGKLIATVLVALVVAAGCVVPFETAGQTATIQQVGTATADGYRYDYYRNTAYPCAISGYQTFVVGTRFGSEATAPRPLWTYLHGGGFGYFDATGTPMPGPEQKNEESAASLRAYLTNGGLMAKVRADAAAFRTLAVSYCSHDLYGGANSTDPNNPNLVPGSTAPRTTNGLLATKAAIQFVQARYATTKTFLHGTSAGSGGSFAVAWSMQRQGIPPAGVVADASVAYRPGKAAAIAAGACNETDVGVNALQARIHPELADPANDPDLVVSEGRLTVPIMHIWNHADESSCGSFQLACPMRDGTVVNLGVTDCYHEPLRRAINAQGPASRSKNLPLCVDIDPVKDCSTHVVTNRVGAVNTDPASPADYLTAIIQWVDQRLTDP